MENYLENFTKEEVDYYELLLDSLDDGIISSDERRFLDKQKVKLSINDSRALELESIAEANIRSKKLESLSTEEMAYYDLVCDGFNDGNISDDERLILNKRKSKSLILASEKGDLNTVKFLISTGFDINVKDNIVGWTALMEASRKGHTEIAKALIETGVDVNVKNIVGYTALMEASEKGYTEIVKALIEARVDVNVKGLYGWNALGLAYKQEHTNIIEILENAGSEYPSGGVFEKHVIFIPIISLIISIFITINSYEVGVGKGLLIFIGITIGLSILSKILGKLFGFLKSLIFTILIIIVGIFLFSTGIGIFIFIAGLILFPLDAYSLKKSMQHRRFMKYYNESRNFNEH